MIPVSCVLILVMLLFVYRISKNFSHPIILFGGLWMCCLVCAGLRLYGMRPFSNDSVIIVLLGLAGFVIGVLIAYYVKTHSWKLVLTDSSDKNLIRQKSFDVTQFLNYKLTSRAMYLCLFCAYAGIFVLLFYVLRNLAHGVPYSYIRNMYYGYGKAKKLIPSTFINTFLNWISVPSLYALIPIAMVNVFEKKGNKLFSVFVFLAVALYIFGSAGRFMLLFLVIQGISMIKFYGKRIPKKMKKKVIIAVSAVVFILLIITKIRASGSAGKKVNSFYAYLSIPVYLLDYWLGRSGGIRLHGGAFFYGVLSFFNYFTSKLGFDIPLYRQAYEVIQVTQDKWVKVFPNEWYNAYVSMFYYFYIDFGIIGVIAGCMLFGYVCYIVYDKAFGKKNKKALIYYMLLIQCIVCSLVRWQIGTITMVLTFAIEYVLISSNIKIIDLISIKLKSIRIRK